MVQSALLASDNSDAHLAEICELLALGLVRLRAHQFSGKSAFLGESSLDCAADQSSGANRSQRSEGQGGEGANGKQGQGKIKGHRAGAGRKARQGWRAARRGQPSEKQRSSGTIEGA